jgi:glycosyltransferase involved in cell wall biosynthesis
MTHRPIRVLQLGSPAGLYGAERWILALVRHLDPAKVTSVVGVIKDDPGSAEPPLVLEAAALGFETLVIQAPGRINLSGVRKLRQYILENQIDILHTHWYKTDIIGLLAVMGTRCKIISTPHGWSRQAGLALKCYEMMDRMVFPLLDAVVPLSPDLYGRLEKIPFLNKKLTLIQNGVDMNEINAVTTIPVEISGMKQTGHVVIGYIGRLIQGKGIDTLLNALAQIRSFSWRLVVVGEGDHQEHLMRVARDLHISGHVLFTGFKQNRLSYLKGFDLFVLPSLSEGIPRCLMEAMAAEIPVVASDISGCRILVEHGHTGFLFEPENDVELAWLLEHLTKDKLLVQRTALKAARQIKAGFSAEKMASDYQYLYARVNGGQR